MSRKDIEAAFIVPPLKNTPQFTSGTRALASPTPAQVHLPTVFGLTWRNHMYQIEADGGKIYFALSDRIDSDAPISTGHLTIWPSAVQYRPGWCKPIPDGNSREFFIPSSGKLVASGGHATTVNFGILHFATPSGTPSAWMQIGRSSMDPNENVGKEFRSHFWPDRNPTTYGQ